MPTNLPKDKKIVPIRQASQILGVSIDTIRRWDKDGTLHSTRPNGKDRYFSIEELERVKLARPLTISEMSKKLGMSQSTLRRLEKKGILKASRNENGEREYTQKALQDFLNSSYFLRKNDVESKILEPLQELLPPQKTEAVLEEKIGEEKTAAATQSSAQSTEQRVAEKKDIEEMTEEIEKSNDKLIAILGTRLQQHDRKIKSIIFTRQLVIFPVLIFLIGSGLIIGILSYLFATYPSQMAKFFAYGPAPSEIIAERKSGLHHTVLGAATGPGGVLQGIATTVLRPYANISLQVVKTVKPETYQQVAPQVLPPTTNNLFQTNQSGEIQPNGTIVISNNSNNTGTSGSSGNQPAATNLKVTTTTVIPNLNADFVRGKKPGTNEGDLAILGPNGTVNGLTISTADIGLGSIIGTQLANGTITAAQIANNTITTAQIADGTFTGADLAANAGIANGQLNQLTASNLVAGSAVQLSGSGGLTNNNGLSLSTNCANNQTLIWNGNSWVCGTPSSGTISGVTAGNGLTGGGTTGTVSLAVLLPTSGTSSNTSSNSGFEVSASGVSLLRGCSDSQVLTWNSTSSVWQCANQTGGGGGGVATIKQGGTNVVTSATAINFDSGGFAVTNAGGGQGNVGLATTAVTAGSYGSSGVTVPTFTVDANGRLTAASSYTISGLTNANLSGSAGITNANLANSSVTVTAGTGLSGGGAVSLGSSTTLNLANTAVVAGSYGSSGLTVPTFTVDAQGRLTAASSYTIQDATALQKGVASFSSSNFSVTSGAVSIATGGVGATELASTAVTGGSYGSATSVPTFTVDADGRLTAASNTTITGLTASNLSAGDYSGVITSGTYAINVSGSAGSATSATTATNANNVNLANDTTSGTDYLVFSNTATGNQPLKTNAGISVNPNTGLITATTFAGALSGNATTATSATSATTATNATNVATTATTTNALYYPLFVSSSSNGNQAASLGTGLTFNPSSGTLTATTFSGALSGNAVTATKLQTARSINGVSFDGSADITVAAAAGTVTGTTLASNVTGSSLTSVGNLVSGTVIGTDTFTTNTITDSGALTISSGGSGNLALNTASGTITSNATAVNLSSANLTVASCTGCGGGGSGTNFLRITNGALSPVNDTLDLLVGSQSSSSAKFAVSNVSGTPVASVSSGLNGVGAYLTADGTLGTTSKQPLVLGSSTTGVVNFFNSTNSLTSGGVLTVAGGLNVSSGSVSLPNTSIANAALQGSGALTVTAGTGLSGGGSVALGSSTTLNLADTAVTAGSYGSSGKTVPTFTVDQQGRLTAAGSYTISGLTASNLTAGDFSSVINTGTYSINVSGSAGSATSATSATTATNATNVATTAVSNSATYYPLFVGSSSNGNQAASLGTGLTFNPNSNTLTTTTFSGALSGNATTATKLATARNINGVSFDGSADITVAAAAGTLTGTTLASNVVSSSLTSVGTLVSGTKIGSQTFTTNNIVDSGALTIASGGSGNLALNTASGTVTSNATAVNFGSAVLTVSSCNGCVASSGSNYWTLNAGNGTLYPVNTSLDLFAGGTGTTSAKFAVLNLANGTPVASVSSGLNGVSSYLSSNGTLATTNMQPLVLGASTTGAINIGTDSTARFVTIGNTTGASSLTLAAGSGNINFYNSSNKIDSSGNLTLAGTITANTTNTINGVSINAGTITGATIAAGSNTISGLTASNLTAGDFSSKINSGTYSINISGSAGSATTATTATNANNVNLANDTASATDYLVFSNTATGNQPLKTNTGISVNPSTGVLSATTFSGALSGNASTATKLATARNINGVSFDGSADITIAAAAGTLTGTTLASNVTGSSLTSVGNLVNGTVIGTDTFNSHQIADSGALNIISAKDSNLTLGSNSGVGNVQITPNAGGQAALMIINNGVGDLLTASAGATPKFTVQASGNVVGTGSLSGFTIAAGSNTISGLTATNLTAGDFSSKINSGTYSINISGSAGSATSATTATNATNVATTAVSNSATYYPLFVGSSSNGNQAASLGTGLTFNPNTNTLTTTTFSGALSGNATTATTLQTGRTINGVTFDGSGNIVVAAAAGTLTGTSLASGVTGSSLTSVGSLVTGTVIGTDTFNSHAIADSGALTIASGGSGNLALNTASGTITSNATAVNFGSAALTVSSCIGCGGGGSNFWTLNGGTLYPVNTTLDLFAGGTGTTSAKFAVLNMTGSGTPTASVSSGLNGAGVYLDATGKLATTSKQNLTLGDANTGGILIGTDANARSVSIGNTTGASSLTLSAGSGNINFYSGSNNITSSGALTLASTITANTTNTINSLSINSGALSGVTGITFSSGNLALGGGNITNAGTIASGANTITSTSANALAVGRQGTTNPVLDIDASTANVVTGLQIKGAAAAGGLALTTTSSGTDENLTLDAKGAGTVTINGTATGAVTVGHGLTLSSGTLALGSNTVSGTPTWSSNQAITLSTASQPNVTSLGTLTGLTVNGGVTLSGGAVSINDNSNNTTSIGGGTTTSSITLGGTGTQTLNLGNGAGIKTVNLGSNNTTSTTTILSGTGNIILGGTTGVGNILVQPNAGGNAALVINKQADLGFLNPNIFVASSAGVLKFAVDAGGNATATGSLSVGQGGNKFLVANNGNITATGSITGLTGITLSSGILALGSNTVSGTPTWSSNQAITLSTAAQPNITSLGTLSSLTVSGAISGATSSNTINNLVINSGALSGVTGITFSSGNITGAGTIGSGAITVTSASTNALAVGRQGATSPALQIDSSTNASSVTGLKVVAGAAGGGLALSTVGGNTDENLTLDAKGAGTVTINGTATGVTTIGHGLTLTSGTTLTLTGDTITGAPTWGSNQAITLSTASQPNITSLGTLSSLTVSGAISGATSSNTINNLIINGATQTLSSHSIADAGALTVASGGSSGLTLDSASGRVGIATGDFLSISVAGTTNAAAGDIWYDSTAQKFKINEAGTTKTLCNTTDAGCGTGGAVTLQGAYNGGSTIDLSASDLIIGNNATGVGGLLVNPNAGGDAALIVNKQSLFGDVFTASSSGTTAFVIKNDGTILMGGATLASSALSVSNLPGGTPTATVSGNLVINNKPNTAAANIQSWTKLTGTAGTIGGGTAGVASVSASVMFNGSLYVGTSNPGNAEIYRYDGDGAGTWTKVSGTAGTVGGNATTAIDMISSLTVYNGYLYAGTTKANSAEVYRYKGGSSWEQLNVTGTAGKFQTTTSIDGVTSMAVFGGRLFIGTREAGAAQLYMYNGGTSWVVVNTTAGTFVATNTIAVDAVTQMAVVNNQLVLGLLKNGDADVVRWNGIVGGSNFFALNLASTTGSYLIDNSAQTGYNEVTAMTVWAGKLVIGLRRGAGQADILMYQEPPGGAAPINSWTRLNTAVGQIITTSIDSVPALTVYQGRLYAGTFKSGAAEIYRYDEGKNWTKVSQTGQIAVGGTSGIDGIATLLPYNNSLFAGTWEGTSAEGYTYTSSLDQSYALMFHASSSQDGGEQNGQTNTASIYFVASLSANLNNKQGNTGAFVFDHSIVTNSGSYDVAEDYPTRDDTLESGDVISMETNERGFVRKSSGPYDYAVMGVYSEKPALRLSQEDATINGGHAIPVALAGRVPVKVSIENGAIKAGDYLTASSVDGVAMKAKKSGIVIGQAMEPYDSDGVGKILVYVKSATYQGSIASNFAGIDTTASDSASNILTALKTQGSGLGNSEVVTDRIVAGLDIITPKITADEIFAKVIHADQIEGLTILTNKISALDSSVSRLASASAAVAADMQAPAVLGIATPSSQLSLESLNVDGLATVSADLRVKGNGLIEGMLTVLDNLTAHNMIVTGISDFFGNVVFHNNLTVNGKVQVGQDTAGVAVVTKGQTSVHVEFSSSYDTAPVVTASLTDTQSNADTLLAAGYSYIITNRTEHGFTIQLNKTAQDDVTFSWTALEAGESSIVPTASPTTVPQPQISPTPQPTSAQAQ